MDKTVKEKLPAEPNAYMIDRAVRYLRDAKSIVALEDIFVCAVLDFLEADDWLVEDLFASGVASVWSCA